MEGTKFQRFGNIMKYLENDTYVASYVGIYTMVMSYIKGVARHTYIFICIHLRAGVYASNTTNHGVYDKYTPIVAISYSK